MANVFNTFSFNKWADTKKEEEIDKESRKRRHEQIKRLKDKLRREREMREAGLLGGDGDIDLDALIEALQQDDLIMADQQPWENWDNHYVVPGMPRQVVTKYEAGAPAPASVSSANRANSAKKKRPQSAIIEDPREKDPDYLLEEIRNKDLPRSASASGRSEPNKKKKEKKELSEEDKLRWQYNRRHAELMGQVTQPRSASARRTRSASARR